MSTEERQTRIQSLLSELVQLGVIKEVDIPEITPGVVCEVIHKTLPTDVVEIEGIPTPVGETINKTTTITERGKLYVLLEACGL